MNESRQTVIVTSDEPWSDVWHTQLHYAHQLAKQFNVIFLEAPKPWKFSRLFRYSLQEKKVEENLAVIRYVNPLPAIFGSIALSINDRINEALIKRKFFGKQVPDNVLVWHFDRYRSYRIFKKPSGIQHIYHVIDPQANLNGDIELSLKSDLVIVTSPRFMDHYRALNKNVIQIGQGFDATAITGNAQPDNKFKDSIVLLGTINDSIDFNLLQEIAVKFPNPLVLIGPDKIAAQQHKESFKKLLDSPRVHWTGAIPPSQFYKYLNSCKVGLIAYDLSGTFNNTQRSPLKVISYLAYGKCVISNIDCEIPELRGKAVYLATVKNEYFEKLKLALEDNLVIDTTAVNAYLDSISYKRLLQKIFSQLTEKTNKH